MESATNEDGDHCEDSHFEKIILNEDLQHSFFDSDDEQADNLSDESFIEPDANFKFNQDHALFVFNTLKMDPLAGQTAGNLFEL